MDRRRAKLDVKTPKPVRIEIEPKNPIITRIGDRQQFRVLAYDQAGIATDVTRDAFLESSNNEITTTNKSGLFTAIRRGEASVLVRYEGAYDATVLTVMGDRTGFAWKQPETWGKIDELVADKWQRMKIEPSELASDAHFIRRAYLDLTVCPHRLMKSERSSLTNARAGKARCAHRQVGGQSPRM